MVTAFSAPAGSGARNLKSSFLESQMPSAGKTVLHSCGRIRYSTVSIELQESSAWKAMSREFLSRTAEKLLTTGRELSTTNAGLIFSVRSSVPGGWDGRAEASSLRKYVPSGKERVSKTKSDSFQPSLITRHAVSPSFRSETANCSRSSFSSEASQATVW